MNHAVLFTVFNQVDSQLELTKEAWASICAQDVGELDVTIINNGSTQPTVDWLNSLPETCPPHVHISGFHYKDNVAPVLLANKYLSAIFETHQYVLCCPNDVVLPTFFYRKMLECPRGIVTASETKDKESVHFAVESEVKAVSENTPMAVCLLRRWVYDALVAKDGYFFDPRIWMYVSDCDYALRIAACGIRGVQLDMNFYHFGSGSHRMLADDKARIITSQADADREYFQKKWGFRCDALEYGACAQNINFRG